VLTVGFPEVEETVVSAGSPVEQANKPKNIAAQSNRHIVGRRCFMDFGNSYRYYL